MTIAGDWEITRKWDAKILNETTRWTNKTLVDTRKKITTDEISQTNSYKVWKSKIKKNKK